VPAIAELDRYWPPRGPCWCCGGSDARHREFDAIRGRWKRGESPESIAADFGVNVEAIIAVVVACL
jgi:hypothetical protein